MTKTEDYGLFKSVQGNRVVDPNHVQKLLDAIEAHNLLERFPILVNDKMEVIDGQHRLAAAAALQVPIFYEIEKGLTLNDVIQINTSSRSWTMANYVDSFIELGKKDYQKLKDFKHEYDLSWSIATYLLAGETNRKGSASRTQVVKQGNFVASRTIAGKEAAELIAALKPLSAFNTCADAALAPAIIALLKLDEFDSARLLGKLKVHGLQLQRRVNSRYYLLELEEIYNFQARDKVKLYRGQM